MNQLTQKFYSCSELAELTGVSEADKKHFKRNVETALTKWGYGFDWIHGKGATITHVPESAEERLQEVLVRQFHVDIQVDMYYFACYVAAFVGLDGLEGFNSMPWGVREDKFDKFFGKHYTSRTLSSWCKQLIKNEIMDKSEDGTFWKTIITESYEKIRKPAEPAEAQEYFKRRSVLLDELTLETVQKNKKLSYEAARKEAWKDVYPILWNEFNCCYYFCKKFRFFAFNENGSLFELFELIQDILIQRGIINGKLRIEPV